MRINSSGTLSGTPWCLCPNKCLNGHQHWVGALGAGREKKVKGGAWQPRTSGLVTLVHTLLGGKLPRSALNIVSVLNFSQSP